MLIGHFSQRTGLSPATIRFYVRKRLLSPESGRKGGRNPYAQFTERDVQRAAMIRFGQSLGMSLADIARINDEMQEKGLTRERAVEIMDTQLRAIEDKAQDLAIMAEYLRAKRDWIADGQTGEEPNCPPTGSVHCQGKSGACR
ncbi:MerR family transcriptional regulator [Acetobacter farinalis]|uniref:MerR family transcriptional regulator n=1 Tax=Acetobacter farinalis TaxID=1260984 RepID=A0ABT3Q4I7_9PROT|nr:MerR family transcriptional regulator [Acetobacter farinalis]MCX2560194.1 MerR family transcriptional regulator [Acetobacter farinalis]NHO28850.1 MerR family transcriptional regulator [Acetobacter farinalis]